MGSLLPKSVQEEDHGTLTRSLVDVVHAQPRLDLDVVRSERIVGEGVEALVGCAEDVHAPPGGARWTMRSGGLAIMAR